uniref:Uncharacterized protein n=1 Tax=Neobodo designis TaxID=312471 RepID=A0A6U4SD85_NEODS
MANLYDAVGPTTAIVMQTEDRARPFFSGGEHSPANNIRGYFEPCCCGMRPGTGPNVPPHWYDGGHGWTTKHFTDIEPFSFQNQTPGAHRCKYCSFVAEGREGCCGKGACWCPIASAPPAMERHLIDAHGIQPPPRRKWATELCECGDGCLESICCWQCQASRQIMAQRGWANTFNCFWCLYFTFAGGSHHDEHGRKNHVACIILAAWLNRRSIRELHNIDEGCCETLMISCCCPHCSIAQTYREYSAAGVWPGGVLVGDQPPAIMMDQPPPHLMNGPPAMAPQQQGEGYAKMV